MAKQMVFNYKEHERALEEIAKLKEDIANLQIRCRIAESNSVANDRDCKSCRHHKNGECSRWDCEYEPINDLISRQDAINCCSCLHPEECWDEIRKLPSADRPTGKWIGKFNNTCSICGEREDAFIYGWGEWEANGQSNYCPNCGTRMTPYKGGEEE